MIFSSPLARFSDDGIVYTFFFSQLRHFVLKNTSLVEERGEAAEKKRKIECKSEHTKNIRKKKSFFVFFETERFSHGKKYDAFDGKFLEKLRKKNIFPTSLSLSARSPSRQEKKRQKNSFFFSAHTNRRVGRGHRRYVAFVLYNV